MPLACVAVPAAAGTLVGVGVRRCWRWVPALVGRDPAPRAWDHLFADRPVGWVRLKLKSGTWLAGAFAAGGRRRSYAAGYPEAQDLDLTGIAEVDPDDGSFLYDADVLRTRDAGLLVRWEEVEYLEFVEG